MIGFPNGWDFEIADEACERDAVGNGGIDE